MARSSKTMIALNISCCLIASLVPFREVFAEGMVLDLPEVGQSIDIVMTSTRETKRPGQAASKHSGATPIHIKVLESKGTETIVSWTFGRTRVNGKGMDEEMAARINPLLSLNEGKRLELVFDDELTLRSIRNVEEVMEMTQKSLDALVKTLPKHVSSEIVPQVREMFSNPETVVSLLIQDPGRYFLVYGWELAPGVPRREEMQLPNPFGGEPLPANMTLTLEPYQPQESQLVVKFKQELDKEAVSSFTKSMMKKAVELRKDEELELPKLEIADTATYTINRTTGWVERASVVRKSTAAGGSRTDIVEFRIAPPEEANR